jgi:hypothetical protein
MTDEQTIRRELFAAINAGIGVGLPAPEEISFSIEMPHIDLDSAADLCGWADWLGYTGTISATFGQPASHLDDPLKADRWITSIYFGWRGTRICLYALDPITPEQAQHWIDSGAAARHADRIAEQREHERIILPADAPGMPECSPACDDQDGDQPHLADCPARPGSEA